MKNNCILRKLPEWQQPKLSRIGDEMFTKGKVYRYINQGNGYVIVNGVGIPAEVFNKYFIDYTAFLVSKLKEVGVYDNDKKKLVSLNSFKKDYCDMHTYKGNRTKTFVAYIGHPKKNCFQLFLDPNITKAIAFRQAYDMLNTILSGENDLAEGEIVWGNSGIPISLCEIRIK